MKNKTSWNFSCPQSCAIHQDHIKLSAVCYLYFYWGSLRGNWDLRSIMTYGQVIEVSAATVSDQLPNQQVEISLSLQWCWRTRRNKIWRQAGRRLRNWMTQSKSSKVRFVHLEDSGGGHWGPSVCFITDPGEKQRSVFFLFICFLFFGWTQKSWCKWEMTTSVRLTSGLESEAYLVVHFFFTGS